MADGLITRKCVEPYCRTKFQIIGVRGESKVGVRNLTHFDQLSGGRCELETAVPIGLL